MTQIHISIRKPKTGGLDPVTGLMRFRPVRRHFDADKNLIIAASFDADLSESGELTVDLLPTTSAFVWQVIELADTPQAYTRYVEVPDSKTKVEYADLVEVDAGTFVPKDMQGSQLLKVRHASTQSEAEYVFPPDTRMRGALRRDRHDHKGHYGHEHVGVHHGRSADERRVG